MADGIRKMMEEVAEEVARRTLAELGDDFGFGQEWLDERQAARLLAFSPKTLERFRAEGTGPAYCRVGRYVRYSREDVRAWAAAQGRVEARS